MEHPTPVLISNEENTIEENTIEVENSWCVTSYIPTFSTFSNILSTTKNICVDSGSCALKILINDQPAAIIVNAIRNNDQKIIDETCLSLISFLITLREPSEVSFKSVQVGNIIKLEFFTVDTLLKKALKVGHNGGNFGDDSKSMYILLGNKLFRDKLMKHIVLCFEAKRGLMKMFRGHARNAYSDVADILEEMISSLVK